MLALALSLCAVPAIAQPRDVEPYRTADGEPFDDRDHAGTDAFPPLDRAVSFPCTPVLEDGEEDLKVPAWLNDVTLYHNRGDTTFVGEDSLYGDVFGRDAGDYADWGVHLWGDAVAPDVLASIS